MNSTVCLTQHMTVCSTPSVCIKQKRFAMRNSNLTQHKYRIHYTANNSAAQQFVARVTMRTLDTTLSIPASCQNQLHPVMTKQATAGLSPHSHQNIH